jgi:hypothetical protein
MSGAAGGRVVRPRMKFTQQPLPPKFAKGREWCDEDGVSLKWLVACGFKAKAEEVRRKWAVGEEVRREWSVGKTRAQTMAGACESQAPHERRQHIDTGPVEQLEAGVSTAREQVEELEEAVGEPDDPRASAEVDPSGIPQQAPAPAAWLAALAASKASAAVWETPQQAPAPAAGGTRTRTERGEHMRQRAKEHAVKHACQHAVIIEDAGEPLPAFFCPINFELMRDPVSTADGQTYERSAIESWLEHKDTSPLTGAVLPNKALIPNVVLRQSVHQWEERVAQATKARDAAEARAKSNTSKGVVGVGGVGGGVKRKREVNDELRAKLLEFKLEDEAEALAEKGGVTCVEHLYLYLNKNSVNKKRVQELIGPLGLTITSKLLFEDLLKDVLKLRGGGAGSGAPSKAKKQAPAAAQKPAAEDSNTTTRGTGRMQGGGASSCVGAGGCGALVNLGARNTENVASLDGTRNAKSLDLIDKALQLMSSNPDSEDIQVGGCTDLHALACKSKRNAVAIASVGGISSTILAAMDRHSSNASVVDAAIDVLHMLATKGDAKNLLQDKIADAGSIQKIIDAMDCHTDNAELQESACNTLRALLNRDEVCKKHVTLAGGGLRGMLKERVERAMGMEGARAKTVDHGDKILRFLGILGDP